MRGKVMPDIIDLQQPPRRSHRLFFLVLAILAVVIFSSRTALSYYVDAGRVEEWRHAP
jgi:hypothetical protein